LSQLPTPRRQLLGADRGRHVRGRPPGRMDPRLRRPREHGGVHAERRPPAAALRPRHRPLGTSGTTVEANRVTGNSPTLDAPVSGGIVLASSGSFDGSAPSDTVVRGNHAARQHPGRPRLRRLRPEQPAHRQRVRDLRPGRPLPLTANVRSSGGDRGARRVPPPEHGPPVRLAGAWEALDYKEGTR
jgi:hypothetical protein